MPGIVVTFVLFFLLQMIIEFVSFKFCCNERCDLNFTWVASDKLLVVE